MTLRGDISKYFSGAISGFVGNKFRLTISSTNFRDLRFYVKSVSLPYESLNFVDDIYVSDMTLARPKNVLSVQTHSDLSVKFRMDPKNEIIQMLEMLFASNHNLKTYEASKNTNLFSISVDVYGSDYKLVNSYKYHNCSLFEMSSYEVDASDRKFKEYDVIFTCNRVGPDSYSSTSSFGQIKTSCGELRSKVENADRILESSVRAEEDSNHSISDDRYMKLLLASGKIPAYASAIAKSECKNIPKVISFQVGSQSVVPKIRNACIAGGIPGTLIEIQVRPLSYG